MQWKKTALSKFYLRKKLLANKERERLEKFLGGIADMPRIPDVMYIVDPRKERIAVQEAQIKHSYRCNG